MHTQLLRLKKLCIALLISSVVPSITQAATLHLKPNAASGKDADVTTYTPSTNFGSHIEFAGQAWTCGGNPCTGRGLLQFDLSSIPANAAILSAHISLFANPTPQNGNGLAMQGNNEGVLQRITSTWNENTVTWNLLPSTTTQNRVILPMSASSFQNYTNIDVKNMVQDMVNDPSNSYGFLLKLTNETFYTTMTFASSDYADSTLWPEITINYTTPTCVSISIDDNGQDAGLASGTPTTNFFNHEGEECAAWTCSGSPCFAHSLFEFDLTSIPSNAQITYAGLDLFANPSPLNFNGIAMQGANAAWLERVTSSWQDNTVTWSTAPTTTVSNRVAIPQSTSSFQDYPGIEVTNLVQDMISLPNQSFGFMIRLQSEIAYACMAFASGDYTDPNKHPILHVCYITTSGINELDNPISHAEVFPNPFSSELTVNFDLKSAEKVKYDVQDVLGQNILSENLGILSAGAHDFVLNNSIGQLPDAVYFLRIQAGDSFIVKQLLKQ